MHFDQRSKKSLQLQKAVRRDIRSSAGLYVHIFKFFLAHASLPHILIILTEPCLSCNSEVDPRGDSKICRYILPKFWSFQNIWLFSSWVCRQWLCLYRRVNAVIANQSGPNQALVGNKAQPRLYLKASVFSGGFYSLNRSKYCHHCSWEAN